MLAGLARLAIERTLQSSGQIRHQWVISISLDNLGELEDTGGCKEAEPLGLGLLDTVCRLVGP